MTDYAGLRGDDLLLAHQKRMKEINDEHDEIMRAHRAYYRPRLFLLRLWVAVWWLLVVVPPALVWFFSPVPFGPAMVGACIVSLWWCVHLVKAHRKEY